ncbi:YdcF family protein [Nocardiopsis alba]|uniref:YdcF family protein n=1 Tax=Nocardiopsis alba TaxID=53437 RepID=UPI00381467A9
MGEISRGVADTVSPLGLGYAHVREDEVDAVLGRLCGDGLFTELVFTGGNSPSTAELFPRGEAVHFRERALELGVPDSVILIEPEASNTGQNISFSRRLLAENGLTPDSVLVICMPYMERRAFATTRKLWDQVEVVCASAPVSLGDYVKGQGDVGAVIDMMVGDLQRVMEYPKLGFAIEQEVPREVREAYEFLVASGFDSRLI